MRNNSYKHTPQSNVHPYHAPDRSSKSSKKDSKSHRSSVKQDKSTSKATSPGLRVRSVTELAALVASGAVRVPKGLQHYVADRSELLDQVFNILTPTEVEEMLPDVLKVCVCTIGTSL